MRECWNTDPSNDEIENVASIKQDVRWLGYHHIAGCKTPCTTLSYIPSIQRKKLKTSLSLSNQADSMVLPKQNYLQRGNSFGKSEQAHAVMKDDLAGGKLPSPAFGANPAWWWIMILAFNLNAMIKKLVLADNWQPKRMKAIRFSLINLPARVVKRSRHLIIRLTRNHPCLELLAESRNKIAMLKPAPGG
jgi:hypothetical protein